MPIKGDFITPLLRHSHQSFLMFYCIFLAFLLLWDLLWNTGSSFIFFTRWKILFRKRSAQRSTTRAAGRPVASLRTTAETYGRGNMVNWSNKQHIKSTRLFSCSLGNLNNTSSYFQQASTTNLQVLPLTWFAYSDKLFRLFYGDLCFHIFIIIQVDKWKCLNGFTHMKRLEWTQSLWSRHAYKMRNGKQQTHPLYSVHITCLSWAAC